MHVFVRFDLRSMSSIHKLQQNIQFMNVFVRFDLSTEINV